MRHLKIIVPTVAWLVACAVLAADQQAASGEEDVPPGLLHRPQDVAPPELIVVPRDPSEYRPKGGLLSAAQHQPRRVDADELLRRKYDLYDGRVVSQSLSGPGGPVSSLPARQPTGPDAGGNRNLADIGYWSFVAVCALVASWLLTKVILYVRRRQATPDSVPRGW